MSYRNTQNSLLKKHHGHRLPRAQLDDGLQGELDNVPLAGLDPGQVVQDGVVDLLRRELGQDGGEVLLVVGEGPHDLLLQLLVDAPLDGGQDLAGLVEG